MGINKLNFNLLLRQFLNCLSGGVVPCNFHSAPFFGYSRSDLSYHKSHFSPICVNLSIQHCISCDCSESLLSALIYLFNSNFYSACHHKSNTCFKYSGFALLDSCFPRLLILDVLKIVAVLFTCLLFRFA